MRKYIFLIPILLLWVSAFATDNVGNWDGRTRSNQFIEFSRERDAVTLNILTSHAFNWAAGDTLITATAGVTGVLNVADWTSQYGYFWMKLNAAATEVDVWLQSAPTDSGPWANQLLIADNTNSATVISDSLDMRAAGPYSRFAFVNDTVLTTASVSYFYAKLRKP